MRDDVLRAGQAALHKGGRGGRGEASEGIKFPELGKHRHLHRSRLEQGASARGGLVVGETVVGNGGGQVRHLLRGRQQGERRTHGKAPGSDARDAVVVVQVGHGGCHVLHRRGPVQVPHLPHALFGLAAELLTRGVPEVHRCHERRGLPEHVEHNDHKGTRGRQGLSHLHDVLLNPHTLVQQDHATLGAMVAGWSEDKTRHGGPHDGRVPAALRAAVRRCVHRSGPS
mmetsp:Transcript_69196/g.205975  ORF Transcript_69196/g.205975 Transcript_69196/m.205975 type:complete len:227 (+) Transcript_69196:417-1097(+)